MAINPYNITTIRVDQLAEDTLNLTNDFAHSNGTELKKATIQALVDLVSTAIGSSSGVGYLAISVTDGQQLPDVPTEAGFFLAGAGTYLNVNGYPDVICTENLNAIMSLTDHWELAVEIPINPLTGTVQSVTGSAVDNTDPLNPVINTTGGGGAVDSVNGQTGVVSIDLESVLTEGATAIDKTIELSSSSSDDIIILDSASQTMGVVNPATGDSSAIKSTFIQSVNLTSGENLSLYKDKIRRTKGGFSSDLVFTDPTANRTITFKDESGTVALLTDVPTLSYTPYRFVNTTQTTYLGAVIGLAETPVAQTTILANTFNANDFMKMFFKVSKGTTTSNVTMRIKINTTNTLLGATQIAILTLGTANTYGLMNRNINLDGGNAYAYNTSASLASDILASNTPGNAFTLNTTTDLFVFFTIQLGNALDSATFQLANISN